jgi:hypothetical protein
VAGGAEVPVTAAGPQGATALHGAAAQKSKELVKLLLELGADAAQANEDGEAPNLEGLLEEDSQELPQEPSGEAAEEEDVLDVLDDEDLLKDEGEPPEEEDDDRPDSRLSRLSDDVLTDEEEDYVEEEVENPFQKLLETYGELRELHDQLSQDSLSLQRRVIQWKAGKEKHEQVDKSEGKVTEHKYLNVLHHVHTVRLKLRQQQVKAARMSEELKNQLEEKRAKGIECRDSFREFKRSIARHAEYSRTGKQIPLRIIQEIEDFELDSDANLEAVRGSNISLKNRLCKQELQLRKKDELAENLHVIDFEQLKIENQTLNEKIEERHEELHKLRKKTVITVQVITHMREKLQFIGRENAKLKQELQRLDQELASQRDLVAKTKHERDDYRGENAKLRQQTGILNSDLLTKDYEKRQNEIRTMKSQIEDYKTRLRKLTEIIKAANQAEA